MSVVLAADRLTKSYDRHAALRELSFELKAGRVMGFLGRTARARRRRSGS